MCRDMPRDQWGRQRVLQTVRLLLALKSCGPGRCSLGDHSGRGAQCEQWSAAETHTLDNMRCTGVSDCLFL